jgi:hypothetical protein
MIRMTLWTYTTLTDLARFPARFKHLGHPVTELASARRGEARLTGFDQSSRQ